MEEAGAGRRQPSYMANSDWFFPAVRFQLIIGRGEFNRWWAAGSKAVWIAGRQSGRRPGRAIAPVPPPP